MNFSFLFLSSGRMLRCFSYVMNIDTYSVQFILMRLCVNVYTLALRYPWENILSNAFISSILIWNSLSWAVPPIRFLYVSFLGAIQCAQCENPCIARTRFWLSILLNETKKNILVIKFRAQSTTTTAAEAPPQTKINMYQTKTKPIRMAQL